MTKLIASAVQIVGAGLMVTAAFMVSIVAGFAAAGLALLVFGVAAERG